jgi:predicted  nucleic acid-binding Zn-ribbon protein
VCKVSLRYVDCSQPKFLTKEEREKEALRKRQEEVEKKKKAMEEERKRQAEFLKQARHTSGFMLVT